MIIIPDELRRPAEVERDALKKQLADARADVGHWKGECNALQRMVHEAQAVIEQLKLALKTLRKYPHTYKMTGQGSIVVYKDLEQCDAALLAAERGERNV